jgi:tRNA/tmRNA/rRNA uracil-C5-methylase (TrmA/RlmC/RlmD family)
MRPMHGPTWGYRYRARLSVRCGQEGRVLVGFHERHSSYVADMTSCEIMPDHLSDMLVPLRELIARCRSTSRCRRSRWRSAKESPCWCCASWRP